MMIIIKVEKRKIWKETAQRCSWESQHVPCVRPFMATTHFVYGWKSVYQIEFDGTLERFLDGVFIAGEHFCSICRRCRCHQRKIRPFRSACVRHSIFYFRLYFVAYGGIGHHIFKVSERAKL